MVALIGGLFDESGVGSHGLCPNLGLLSEYLIVVYGVVHRT